MAAPTTAGTPATTSDQTAATSHTLNLPASIVAGETLILWAATKCPAGEAAMTGWTRFVDVANVSGSNASLHGFWKKATGSEGATVTFTCVTSSRVSSICRRWTGAADPTVNPPEATTGTTVNITNVLPDPPAITPSGGSKDYAIDTAFGASHGRIGSAAPTNYSDMRTAGPNNGTVTNVGCSDAVRGLTAATTEDPGVWASTGTGVEETAQATAAIYPTAGGTAWTKTVTEAEGAVDGATHVSAYTRPRTETLGGLDSISRVAAYVRNPATEAVGLLDSRSRAFGQFTTDPVGVLDGASRLYAGHRTQTDAEGLLDSSARVVAFTRPVTDPEGILDSRLRAFGVFPTDPVGLLDSISRVAGYARTPSDLQGLTDSIVRLAGFHRTVGDLAGIVDTASRLYAAHRTSTDPEGLLDAATHLLNGGGGTAWSKSPSDSVGLLDAAARLYAGHRSAGDVVGLLDSVFRAGGYVRVRTDVTGLTDGVVRAASGHRTTGDIVGVLDGAGRVARYVRVPSDALGVLDGTLVVWVTAYIVRGPFVVLVLPTNPRGRAVPISGREMATSAPHAVATPTPEGELTDTDPRATLEP